MAFASSLISYKKFCVERSKQLFEYLRSYGIIWVEDDFLLFIGELHPIYKPRLYFLGFCDVYACDEQIEQFSFWIVADNLVRRNSLNDFLPESRQLGIMIGIQILKPFHNVPFTVGDHMKYLCRHLGPFAKMLDSDILEMFY